MGGDALAGEALRSLMVRYQQGDAAAFESLYAGLAPALRRYLLCLARDADTADDLLQETFLQVHRSRRTYNPACPVRPWAFGIARHVHLMHQRSRMRRPQHRSALDDLPELPVPPVVERLAEAHEVRRALGALSPEQCEVLLLHHVWGFSFEEIAGLFGVRAGAARARASRGLAALRAGWSDRNTILEASRTFASGRGKLVRLEFPRTEIQTYGGVAILYSNYVMETESGGRRDTQIAKATEVFVSRDGKWINPGWQLAADAGRH